MKRNVLHTAWLSLVLLLAMGVATIPARAQVGIGVGLDFNELDDIEAIDADATFENSTGYHIGVFYDAEFGPIAIRPGVFYRELGQYEFSDLPGVDETIDIELSTIEIPVDVRLRLASLSFGGPYLLAGPVLSFPQSSDDFEGTDNVNLTADIGAGVEINLPGVGVTLMPELRYSIGTSSFLDDEFEVDGVTVQPQDDSTLNTLALRLNLKF